MRTKFLYVLAAVAVMLLTVWACEEDYGYMPDVQERPDRDIGHIRNP